MNFIVPFVDRSAAHRPPRAGVALKGQPVITEDNLVVHIDTVLFFQVTDPRAADSEIVNYIQAISRSSRPWCSVIGNMDLEDPDLADKINTMLRGVLDEASGKLGPGHPRGDRDDPLRASLTRWKSRPGRTGARGHLPPRAAPVQDLDCGGREAEPASPRAEGDKQILGP
jgi:regulator of protease activity HflC (stomatin/prohibitin superfamily)